MKKLLFLVTLGLAIIGLTIAWLCLETSSCRLEIETSWEKNYLIVNVSALSRPAEDNITLILTNPRGKTMIKKIPKEALIDGFEVVKFRHGFIPPSGQYEIMIKTGDKIILKKIDLKKTQIEIEEANINLQSLPSTKRVMIEYSIKIKNQGDLPVHIAAICIQIDEQKELLVAPNEWIEPGEQIYLRSKHRTFKEFSLPASVTKIELCDIFDRVIADKSL